MSDDRVLAVCDSCQRAYAARLVDGRVIVATDDGCCACGEETFVVPSRGLTG